MDEGIIAMTTQRKDDATVLIVGAGPVGLAMACELTRYGIPVRIIEKEAVANDKSKALGIHARTMEVFENMGVVDKFLERGQKLHGANLFYERKRVLHLSFDELDTPYPFVLSLPQFETERLLSEHLRSAGIEVERSTQLLGFWQDADSVTCTLVHADGHEESVDFLWVIGCDGSHSTVRHRLDLPFEGAPYEENFALADVQVEWSNPEDELYGYLGEDSVMLVFPFGNGRCRVICESSVAQPEGEVPPELQYFQNAMDKLGPPGTKLSDPRWMTWFRIHRRCINKYRDRRVFLAGDAAHIHSPAGGQGMNTGIQDAYNLAWKLAHVVRGNAPESLLNSYEAERHPTAQMVLRGTDLFTRTVFLRSPIAQHIRNRVASWLMSHEVVQERAVRTGAMLAVNYRQSPIVGEQRAALTRVILPGARDPQEPGLTQWLDFAHGPCPGDRAPDEMLVDAATNSLKRVFECIRGTTHHLLLFTGVESSMADYRSLSAMAGTAYGAFGELLTVHFIVAGDQIPQELSSDASILLDPDFTVHHKYGASSQCLYLIRPDGYVGFRSQPVDDKTLIAYLSQVLVRHHASIS